MSRESNSQGAYVYRKTTAGKTGYTPLQFANEYNDLLTQLRTKVMSEEAFIATIQNLLTERYEAKDLKNDPLGCLLNELSSNFVATSETKTILKKGHVEDVESYVKKKVVTQTVVEDYISKENYKTFCQLCFNNGLFSVDAAKTLGEKYPSGNANMTIPEQHFESLYTEFSGSRADSGTLSRILSKETANAYFSGFCGKKIAEGHFNDNIQAVKEFSSARPYLSPGYAIAALQQLSKMKSSDENKALAMQIIQKCIADNSWSNQGKKTIAFWEATFTPAGINELRKIQATDPKEFLHAVSNVTQQKDSQGFQGEFYKAINELNVTYGITVSPAGPKAPGHE